MHQTKVIVQSQPINKGLALVFSEEGWWRGRVTVAAVVLLLATRWLPQAAGRGGREAREVASWNMK